MLLQAAAQAAAEEAAAQASQNDKAASTGDSAAVATIVFSYRLKGAVASQTHELEAVLRRAHINENASAGDDAVGFAIGRADADRGSDPANRGDLPFRSVFA